MHGESGSSLAGAVPKAAAAAAVSDDGRRVDLERFAANLERQVEHFTLPNGMAFVVLHRSDAPVVSFHTDDAHGGLQVGAFEEEEGQTGIAHFLEHMAFKGTDVVGTTDAAREAAVLAAQDEVFAELRVAEAAAGGGGGGRRAAALRARLDALSTEAAQYVVPNEYAALLTRAGGVGLNAQTGHDATKYFVSLPANKAELWFALESARWRGPVLRQLHEERAVILEERRLRVDASPQGRFMEAFQASALGNNYARPVIGYEADIRSLGRPEISAFFRKHYGPHSLAVAVVGDVTANDVRRLAEKYFGDWQGPAPAAAGAAAAARAPAAALAMSRPMRQAAAAPAVGADMAAPSATPAVQAASAIMSDSAGTGGVLGDAPPLSPDAVPPGGSPRSRWDSRPANLAAANSISVPSQAGPAANVCFYRPESTAAGSSVALDALADVLSGSRTARMYQNLVLGGKSLGASCATAFPSDKYPCVLVASSVPVEGRSVAQAASDCLSVLTPLAESCVTQPELARVKLAAQVGLAQASLSNARMAGVLAAYQASFGDWRVMLRELEHIQDLDAERLRAAAEETLRPDNMFTALMPRA